MNSSLLLALWIKLWHFHHLVAEKIPEKIDHPNLKYPALVLDLSEKLHGTACPASTEREKRFNDEVSITGNSLFLRNIYSQNEILVMNICDKPVDPVMIYDLKHRTYQIGYEVYYEEGKAKMEYHSKYNRYKPVNIDNKVIKSPKNPSQNVVQSQDGEKNKFSFTNESETLVFQWIPQLTFACSGSRKQILLTTNKYDLFEYIPSECKGYKLDERDMKVYLVSNENRFELWKNQHSYGDIEMSQIIPAWYFRTPSEKLASYRYMNMVPIWKSIADEQLKKVDIYLQVVKNHIKGLGGRNDIHWQTDLSFGISGVLKEPVNRQKMYFSDTNHHRQIPIPKIIYRMIEGGQNGGMFNAIIVIHNDPTHVSDSDRVCSKAEEVSGWEAIKNNDLRTGLTYVCHYHCKKVFPSVKSIICTNEKFSRPLRLDAFSYMISDSYIYLGEDNDERSVINKKFQKLANKTLGQY